MDEFLSDCIHVTLTLQVIKLALLAAPPKETKAKLNIGFEVSVDKEKWILSRIARQQFIMIFPKAKMEVYASGRGMSRRKQYHIMAK